MAQRVVQRATSSTVSVKIHWLDLCSSSLCGLVGKRFTFTVLDCTVTDLADLGLIFQALFP